MRPSEINLPYGLKTLEPILGTLKSLTSKGIEDFILTKDVFDFVRSNDVLCIINDAHRATPSKKILEAISKIEGHKIRSIIIATGTHSAPSPSELSLLLGDLPKILGAEVLVHNSTEDSLEFLGTTKLGTEIKVNPIIFSYKNILCINSVEPHYFAGFTGGIKSIVPGLAARTTVEKNHSWALDPNSEPLNITSNPLPNDLWEVTEFLDNNLFGIQLVSVGSEIYGIHTGELRSAFLKAVDQAKEIFSIKVDAKYDIILSIVYPPLDRSLYQAQKGIENTRQALKDGGELILLAECKEGIGNEAFFNTIKQFKNPDEVMDSLNRESYRFGDHKAYKFASLAKSAKLTLIGGLDEKQCKTLFANYMDITQLENYLREKKKDSKRILVVLDSGTLVVTV